MISFLDLLSTGYPVHMLHNICKLYNVIHNITYVTCDMYYMYDKCFKLWNIDPKTAVKIAGSVVDFDSAVSSKRHSMFIVHEEGEHAQIAPRRSLFPGRKAGQKRNL